MKAICFRCGDAAFATLKVEARIGSTRLDVSAEAGETGICAQCMLGLDEWLRSGREVAQNGLGAMMGGLVGETWRPIGVSAPGIE